MGAEHGPEPAWLVPNLWGHVPSISHLPGLELVHLPANPHLHCTRASHKAGGDLPHPHPITTIPQDPSAHRWEQSVDTRTREPFVTLHFCPDFCLLPLRVGDQLVPNISAWDGELNFSSAWQTTDGAQRGISPSSVSAYRTPC